MNRQAKNSEEERSPADAAERFRRLVDGWLAEDPSEDRPHLTIAYPEI